MKLSTDRMYQAIVDKDPSFEGTFVTAVKTTGIFCRPTCTAKKPKKENVEFFKTAREAILKGYRPCKVCKPLESLHHIPEPIKSILSEIHKDPSVKLKDGELLRRNIEPATIRRWFLKHHGITFHAYQRMNRLNAAFSKVQNGEPLASVAFDSGYESLSGFSDSFKSIFGVSPSNSRNKQIINLIRLETPLGTMFAAATEQGICLLEFSDRKMLETELKTLTKLLNAHIIQGNNKHFDTLKQQLSEYFEGKRKQFSVPLHMPGSDFQKTVWKALQGITYGTTVSYKQHAELMNNAKAVRAIAHANGMNRISILVPCHRVIGTDGNLTGYGGGIWRKKWLLELEKRSL